MKPINLQQQLMQKATMLHSSLYASKLGNPQWSDVKYPTLSKEGYGANVWVFACINAVAESAAGLPLVLYQRKGTEKVEIDSHPLLDLMQKPNPIQTGREFREEFGKYLLLGGRAFIEKAGPSDTKITELWNHQPDTIAVVPNATERVASYVQRTEAGEYAIPKEKLIFWRKFNPLNDLDGLSPMQVAARVTDMDNGANAYNKALLDNGGAPPGVFITDNRLEESSFRRMRAQINRMFGGGKRNAGKPLLLENGSKFVRTGLSPLDMSWKESKNGNRLEICAAFNVPPEIVGDTQNKTYNNYAEARASFYEETVVPFANFFLEKMNNDLVPLFGKDLTLEVDLDKVDALQENTDALWKRVLAAVDSGVISADEAREVIGYSTRGGEADQLRVSKPAGGATGAKTKPEGKDSGAPQKSHTGENSAPFDVGLGLLLDAVKQLEQKQSEADFYDAFEKERAPFVKSAEQLIRKRFKEEAEAVAAAVEKDGEKGLERALKQQQKEWVRLMKAIYTETIDHFGHWNYDRLKEEYDAKKGAGAFEAKFFNRLFTVARQLIQRFIGEISVELVTYINETTREALRMVISDGVDAGHSWAKISRSIRKVYGDDFGPRRSMVIARTEILSASNYGAREGALATGLELTKTWVTTFDGRERDSHHDCNGQTREMNEKYDVGKAKGMYPGDPKLPAGERIQCRCCEKHNVKE